MSTPLSSRVSAPAELRLPQHPAVTEWRTAGPGDVDAVHAVLRDAGRVDHPTYVSPREDVVTVFGLSYVDLASDILLGFTADGEPIATVTVFLHPARDEKAKVNLAGAVRPAWRRKGIGTEVMRWGYERGLQKLASVDAAIPGEITLYTAEHVPDAGTLAERLGLRTVRWFTTMQRDLTEPLPPVELPEGVEAIDYRPELSEAVRVARNDAFRDHWGSLASTRESWSTFVDGPFLRPELSSLAMVDGAVVALCMASVNEEDFVPHGASHAYIDLVGVVRDHRRRGLAPAVIARTMAAARGAGLEQAVLDVDTASITGALGLYERLGFVAKTRDRALAREF